MLKAFASLYLFCLAGSSLGVFVLGVFVAPVVFHSEIIFGVDLLGRYKAGLMMSEIFIRFNYLLLTTAAIIIAFEGFLTVNKRNTIAMAAISVVNVLAIGAYAFLLTPKIISLQALGEEAIVSSVFETMHKLAEIDFKILLATLTISFFTRFFTLAKRGVFGGIK